MRFISFTRDNRLGLAAAADASSLFHGWMEGDPGYPGTLESLIAVGNLAAAARELSAGPVISLEAIGFMPPLSSPGKIICIGLNYADHSAESGIKQPDYPTVFGRFNSGLIGHDKPIIRPHVSEQLDYEGELVAVIGNGGRGIRKELALSHVAGYSLFNDGSVRDYQFKAPQWTMGKNFDGTGAFGPYFVTADELPPGCAGLQLTTRLNGQVVQSASINDLVFDVATLVSTLSEVFTRAPGDIIVTGTPAGVGLARKPHLWMKPGDVCEVELEGLGILRNVISQQAARQSTDVPRVATRGIVAVGARSSVFGSFHSP